LPASGGPLSGLSFIPPAIIHHARMNNGPRPRQYTQFTARAVAGDGAERGREGEGERGREREGGREGGRE
jgi:hypothetical protein